MPPIRFLTILQPLSPSRLLFSNPIPYSRVLNDAEDSLAFLWSAEATSNAGLLKAGSAGCIANRFTWIRLRAAI